MQFANLGLHGAALLDHAISAGAKRDQRQRHQRDCAQGRATRAFFIGLCWRWRRWRVRLGAGAFGRPHFTGQIRAGVAHGVDEGRIAGRRFCARRAAIFAVAAITVVAIAVIAVRVVEVIEKVIDDVLVGRVSGGFASAHFRQLFEHRIGPRPLGEGVIQRFGKGGVTRVRGLAAAVRLGFGEALIVVSIDAPRGVAGVALRAAEQILVALAGAVFVVFRHEVSRLGRTGAVQIMMTGPA